MTTKKKTTTSRARRPAPSLRTTSVDHGDGTTTVHPVDPADTPVIARALLDAAGDPADVATVTDPHGWRVPTVVADRAGAGR